MKKILFIIIIVLIIAVLGCFLIWQKVVNVFSFSPSNSIADQKQEQEIEDLLKLRRQQNLGDSEADPFAEDGIVKILFIGLDNRVGQTNGHCDAIQFIEVNKIKQKITITAVPRGTYSPLPGTGHLPTDYYVSKACEVGGLDYGVKQIERILGQPADYLVLLGFSQALGIFREMDLPANETMQWLRHRQGYAIGEPQRARNHSNFIKQMLIKYTPQIDSKVSEPVQYLVYKLLRTDLSFAQMKMLAQELVAIDLPGHEERIQLLMRPAYTVQDIDYDPVKINEKLSVLIDPIAKIIPEGAYTGETEADAQARILTNMQNGLADPDYVRWAYGNYLWLQIEDAEERETMHYNLLEAYLPLIEDKVEQEKVLADYIIEMEDLDLETWAIKGRDLYKVNFTN